MNDLNEIKVFVKLLGEGTDVWKAVKATKLKNGVFEILSVNQSEKDENWEFTTGDRVKCINKKFSDGYSGLVAVKKA